MEFILFNDLQKLLARYEFSHVFGYKIPKELNSIELYT